MLLKNAPVGVAGEAVHARRRLDDAGDVDAGAEDVLVGGAAGQMPPPTVDEPVAQIWPVEKTRHCTRFTVKTLSAPGEKPEPRSSGPGFGLAAAVEAVRAERQRQRGPPRQNALTTREKHPVLLRENTLSAWHPAAPAAPTADAASR